MMETTKVASRLDSAFSEGLGANTAALASPPQRWEGRPHSAAGAIAAALRLLQAKDALQAPPTLGELVSICSELVFRATGERIRPAVSHASAAAKTSLVVWVDATTALPAKQEIVLVRLSDGRVNVADLGSDNNWACDYMGGQHPGEWRDYENGAEGRDDVTAWAALPADNELGA